MMLLHWRALTVRSVRTLAILLATLILLPVEAGSRRADTAVLDPDTVSVFAKNVEKYAAKHGARVFIIARVGRPADELPKNIEFTHTAIAVYSQIPLADGEIVNGYAIYNLYQKNEQLEVSELVTDYPIDFFWSAHQLKAGIIIPTPDLQMRLLKLIANNEYKTLHNPKYSAISNPFNSQLQNCTEYVLDVINAAIYQHTNIPKLKANAKAYFEPQKLRISRLKLALGSIFMEDVTTKDHGRKIRTTTFTTIAKYLASNDLTKEVLVLNESGEITPLKYTKLSK